MMSPMSTKVCISPKYVPSREAEELHADQIAAEDADDVEERGHQREGDDAGQDATGATR